MITYVKDIDGDEFILPEWVMLQKRDTYKDYTGRVCNSCILVHKNCTDADGDEIYYTLKVEPDQFFKEYREAMKLGYKYFEFDYSGYKWCKETKEYVLREEEQK